MRHPKSYRLFKGVSKHSCAKSAKIFRKTKRIEHFIP